MSGTGMTIAEIQTDWVSDSGNKDWKHFLRR